MTKHAQTAFWLLIFLWPVWLPPSLVASFSFLVTRYRRGYSLPWAVGLAALFGGLTLLLLVLFWVWFYHVPLRPWF